MHYTKNVFKHVDFLLLCLSIKFPKQHISRLWPTGNSNYGNDQNNLLGAIYIQRKYQILFEIITTGQLRIPLTAHNLQKQIGYSTHKDGNTIVVLFKQFIQCKDGCLKISRRLKTKGFNCYLFYPAQKTFTMIQADALMD